MTNIVLKQTHHVKDEFPSNDVILVITGCNRGESEFYYNLLFDVMNTSDEKMIQYFVEKAK